MLDCTKNQAAYCIFLTKKVTIDGNIKNKKLPKIHYKEYLSQYMEIIII